MSNISLGEFIIIKMVARGYTIVELLQQINGYFIIYNNKMDKAITIEYTLPKYVRIWLKSNRVNRDSQLR